MDETLRGSGEGWGHWHFAPGGGRPFKLNYTSRGEVKGNTACLI